MNSDDKDIAEYDRLWRYLNLTLDIRSGYFSDFVKALSLVGAVVGAIIILAAKNQLPVTLHQALLASAFLLAAFSVIGYQTVVALARQTANSYLYYETIADLRDALWVESSLGRMNVAKLHMVRQYKDQGAKGKAARVMDSWLVLPCTINSLVVGAAALMCGLSANELFGWGVEKTAAGACALAASIVLSVVAYIVCSSVGQSAEELPQRPTWRRRRKTGADRQGHHLGCGLTQ